MSAVHAQLPLAFEHRPALTGEDFLVAPSNRAAVAWIDRWPDWPATALVVVGPGGCGKTHLGQVFAAASKARTVTPEDLRRETPARLAAAPACLLDDAEAAPAQGLERPLLHLFNTLAEGGRCLMLTARRAPARWDLTLADLRSRLNAAIVAEIGPPDDALIAAVLVKLFADRQLKIDAEVIGFLTARMERSFDAARRLVAALDAAALAERRNITVPLARAVLAGLAAPPENR